MGLNLLPIEMDNIRKRLDREPNEIEWRVIDAIWSEHCSYKSSKIFLKSFSIDSPNVIMGIKDWQDAGAVDIGDGWAIVIKVESHNHPSAIDPFNGAATGVGGIIRDIISKGAKPIALMDMIRVGNLKIRKNVWLLKNIIAGIATYGNSIGVPVVSGELSFDDTYNDNPLVDVAAIGIVRKDKIKPSIVDKAGLKLVLAGLTGIDGLGGASFASRKLSGEDEIGAVQIADPFAGKIILDVTLEIADKVEAIKDLGGGGLAVAVTEMANGLGAIVDIEKIPLRVKNMDPADVIISETQERMLYAVEEKNVEEVCKAFEEYEYPCSVIGEITSEPIIKFRYFGKDLVSLPTNALLEPPKFLWPIKNVRKNVEEKNVDLPLESTIYTVLSHPDLVSKEWAYSQFDYEVNTSTVVKPGDADSAVVSLPNGKLLAIKADGNPDLCSEDAYECGKGIVAEAYRNLATVGARGIVAVDHLQFGDPKKPEVYYTFVEAIRGIGEATRFFNIPIVGGKVSFYNENSQGKPIKPTPLIVMAGLVQGKLLKNRVEDSSYVVLLGYTRKELGGSLLSKIFKVPSQAPKVRLQEDLLSSEVVIGAINEKKITFAKDISRGGLAASLFNIIVHGYGVEISTKSILSDTDNVVENLFSESSGRFVILTNEPEWIVEKSRSKGIVASIIGKVNKKTSILTIDNTDYDLKTIVNNYFNFLEEVIGNG
ncbi:MAG: phosphoribosylformylglycinamidine synthase subunit PurL [Saccharolobus sp.]|uniref:phosphoribosylformylglycinamidine synthase subunit PurL n=1 Tax=Saccharolobus TaxID=2100760 RepID=UPI001F118F60|nr:phosphoribosylformylglycinamidine synthase subunit PurL [Saccharolobus shibatae]MCH4814845.1 phosphoribosylformylglycinamidine synthase subunit PurL [Saccharolobus shibatae]